MFHKTASKLTALYLAIMMAISLFFSFNVYQLSLQELDRGFRGQGSIIEDAQDFDLGPFTLRRLHREQNDLYIHARNRILARLILINLIILVGGGFLCYYLARRTIQPIEEAHEALERFTADASHELRTPIAAMQTETEVALMNPKLTLPQAKDQLKSNLEELSKLTALSAGLLRLARTKNGDLTTKAVKVESVVNQAVARALPAAEAKHILIKTPDKIAGEVDGDEDSLVEALVIILDNAVKYSPEKSAIAIETAVKDEEIIIRISDQGVGIKATQLPHIFDRFYRADTARSKQQTEGYGLGLAIAKNIIDIHGGELTATSKLGKGSTFTVRLPSHV